MSSINNSETISLLNQRRRELKKAIRLERERQRKLVAPTVQHVQKLLDDHADLYFSADGEYSMKSFSERLQISLKEMKTEIAQLEESIGVHSHDLDSDLLAKLEELAHLERRFDDLDHEIFHLSVDQASEFSNMMQILRKTEHQLEKVDPRPVQDVIEYKELLEDRFSAVLQKKEEQLQSNLKKYQEVYKAGYNGQLIETTAQSIAREIQTRSHDTHHRLEAARERLMKQFFQEQINQHKQMMGKYHSLKNQMAKKQQNYSKSSADNQSVLSSFDEDDSITSKTFIDDLIYQSSLYKSTSDVPLITSSSSKNGVPWKYDVIDQLEALNAREREFMHTEEKKDSIWISTLAACGENNIIEGEENKDMPNPGQEPVAIESYETSQNKAYLEEMRKRLQDLYEKYNELQLETLLPTDLIPKTESVLSTTYSSTPTSRSHSKQSTPVSSSRKRFFGI